MLKQIIKQALKKTGLYPAARHALGSLGVFKWTMNGSPVPPPHTVKQRALRHYAKKFRLTTLVETGTFYGDMIEAMRNDFQTIYSIELSHDFFELAKIRFARVDHIKLIEGDSGEKLEELIKEIKQPALFWLDGHYSGGETARGAKDSPIYEELTHIFNISEMGHVVLIDDARCFGTDPAYPTVAEITKFIRTRRPNTEVVVKDDIIRILPRKEQ